MDRVLSSSDEFQAASNSPSANQLSEASRCCDQNPRGAAGVGKAIGLVMIRSSGLVVPEPISPRNPDAALLEIRQIQAQF
jgi:hypothetical protein